MLPNVVPLILEGSRDYRRAEKAGALSAGSRHWWSRGGEETCMAVGHPEGEDVDPFACGEMSAGENRWIVRQLVAVCGLARTTPRPAPPRGRGTRRFPLGAG